MKKISEFLRTLDSHSIYQAEGIAADFKKETGEDPCWPIHSRKNTLEAIKYSKAGGTLGKNGNYSAWGYEIAISCARTHIKNFVSTKVGRGFAFWEAIEALEKVGL